MARVTNEAKPIDRPATEGRTVVCTIAAKNYLAHARSLMRSVAEHHPEFDRVTLLVDQVDGCFDPAGEPFELELASDLGIPRWPHMSMKYEITELSTAVKPYFLHKLFSDRGAANVIYLDPDIVVFRRFDDVLGLLERRGVVLTPHILGPLGDDKSPGEIDFLRVGTFNLGFLALASHGPWRDLLSWWQQKCYCGCVRDIRSGYFVDQHWMDLAPSLFEGVHILRDPGHNLAYWNFGNRELRRSGNELYVGDSPLVFFHFSGFEYENPDRVSKYQDRFELDDLGGEYRRCFEDYLETLTENGYHEAGRWPYTFAAFPDGVPVPGVLRKCLLTQDPEGLRWPDPYDCESPEAFRGWATRPGIAGKTRVLSQYLLALHGSREDLQRAFPRPWDIDEAAFVRWCSQQAGSSDAFHPAYLGPAADALAGGALAGPAAAGSPAAHTSQRSGAWTRARMALRYYRTYPERVAPHIPPLAAVVAPAEYTGPPGLYARIRRSLIRLGALQRFRAWLGLRTILTVRYFFSYPVEPTGYRPDEPDRDGGPSSAPAPAPTAAPPAGSGPSAE